MHENLDLFPETLPQFQIESFREILPDLLPLFPEHWKEIALYREAMPLDPQFEEYFRREALGGLVCGTMRVEGIIKGYLIVFVAPGLHYQSTLSAHCDVIYIDPKWRGVSAGRKLLNLVETKLKSLKVSLWYANSKNHKQIEFLFRSENWYPAEMIFTKWIGDGNPVPR